MKDFSSSIYPKFVHEILSQTEHKKCGGVIPEIASRAHMEHLSGLIKRAVKKSNLNFCDLDAIAGRLMTIRSCRLSETTSLNCSYQWA